MTAKRLKNWKKGPLNPPPVSSVRCEHGVDEASWNWRRKIAAEYVDKPHNRMHKYSEGRLDQCTRDAVVEVEGTPYCRLHGGQVVLDMYVEGELVNKSLVPPDYTMPPP